MVKDSRTELNWDRRGSAQLNSTQLNVLNQDIALKLNQVI